MWGSVLKPACGLEASHCMGVRSPSRPFSLGQPVMPMGSFTSSRRVGVAVVMPSLFAVVHEGGGAGGEKDGGDLFGDGEVVGAVAEAVPGAGVVVVIEDEDGLGAVEVEFGFGDVFAEVSDVEGGVGAAGAVAFAMEADEHVHGELQLVLCRAAVPFFELGGVGEVGLADEDAVVRVFVDHGAHAADDVVDLGEEVGVDVVVVGIALGVGAGEDGLVAEFGDLRRGWGWRRDGSRLRRGRARTAWRRTWLFRRRGCAS